MIDRKLKQLIENTRTRRVNRELIDELVEARDSIIPEFSNMKPSEKYSACEKLVKLGVLSRTVWNGLDENRTDSEWL